MHRDPHAENKIQISKLIFDTAINWLKCLGGFLHLKSTVGCQMSTLVFKENIVDGGEILIETALHKTKFNYQSWYLTHYCGLEVRIPTQALKSVKSPDNAFDLHPKWARTLPFLIYLCQISTLIFEFSFVEGGLYKYHMKIILKTAKYLPTWGFNQRYWSGI
jgi:hypothetical protein